MSNVQNKDYKFGNRVYKHSLVHENETLTPKKYNFAGDAITHSRFYNCVIKNIDFNKAAVTGSIFERCRLINCNFNDADFEFCEFRNCSMSVKQINNCSFNNSDYINTSLENISFVGCTFTGTYFDNATLKKIKMRYSTLEGACFFKSNFYDLDWRRLNLEYVEFVEPHMSNVIVPFSQIPYMFGMLQYLSNTTDYVRIYDNRTYMSIDEFFEKGIPMLLELYRKNKLYFPMSNIYMFGRDTDYNSAYDALSHEVSDRSMTRDFRGIKFCCKLLSMCKKIDNNYLNKIYHNIINIDISLDPNSAEMKSFTRNIGEIRSMLYKRKKSPTLHVIIRTNVGIENKKCFADLMNQFKNIAKPNRTNQVITSFKLSQNSPLIIHTEVTGNVEFFLPILRSFLMITRSDMCECLSYPLIKSLEKHGSNNKALTESLLQTALECKEKFRKDGIKLFLLEYYTRDCEDYLSFSNKNHYMDDSLLRITEGII